MSLAGRVLAVTILAIGVVARPAAAPPPSTQDLLAKYASGDFDSLNRVGFTIGSLLPDLMKQTPQWLTSQPFKPADARRAIAAFAVEVATLGIMHGQLADALKMLTWTRERLIAPHTPPDAFDRRWHMFVIAFGEGILDIGGVETAAVAGLAQFPGEPRFVLARAWVAERQLLQDIEIGTEVGDAAFDVVRRRFVDAIALDEVRGEAELRLGRVEVGVRRFDAALEHLASAEAHLTERGLIYTARLLRGLALAQLDRTADAEAAYRSALTLVPGAQSATVALSELRFRAGAREDAQNDVRDLLRRPAPADDPWWMYWKGDATFAAGLLTGLRGSLR